MKLDVVARILEELELERVCENQVISLEMIATTFNARVELYDTGAGCSRL